MVCCRRRRNASGGEDEEIDNDLELGKEVFAGSSVEGSSPLSGGGSPPGQVSVQCNSLLASTPATAAHVAENAVNQGLRLRDLKSLVDGDLEWFRQRRYNIYAGRDLAKTMYDVCPELIMPATTCQERVVQLREEDLHRFRAESLFVSDTDLTLDPRLGGSIELGGQQVPTGLTLHGRLCRGGPVRQRYWSAGNSRDDHWWRTSPDVGGRDKVPVRWVAPMPDSAALPRLATPESGTEDDQVGEAEDRVRDLRQLKVGDVVVLRRGISYTQLCNGDGPGYEINSFASHFWGEETEVFFETLMLHAQDVHTNGDPLDRSYYICTFNNNQHRVELGSSWEDSPFNQALKFLAGTQQRLANGVSSAPLPDAVMLFDESAQTLRRKWCVFEAWRCSELGLSLKLYGPDGSIARDSESTTAKSVRRELEVLDVSTAQCSVEADSIMITRAIEDSRGGFVAVHATVRRCFMDLVTFMGSLATSTDPVTGQTLKEVDLRLKVSAIRRRAASRPSSAKSQRISRSLRTLSGLGSQTEREKLQGAIHNSVDVASRVCSQANTPWHRLLLVAPAGSGKTVLSRTLVRRAAGLGQPHSHSLPEEEAERTSLLPVRVPLAELARVAAEGEEDLFAVWARQKFGKDAEAILRVGSCRLVVLDGFDEADRNKAAIFGWLRRWLPENPGVRLLLTTRPSGVENVALSGGLERKPREVVVVGVLDNDGHGQRCLVIEDKIIVGALVTIFIDGLEEQTCFLASCEAEEGDLARRDGQKLWQVSFCTNPSSMSHSMVTFAPDFARKLRSLNKAKRKVRELSAREQFVQDFGFMEANLEPLELPEAASICASTSCAAGQAKTSLEPAAPVMPVEKLLSELTEDLWQRPLMASLLGQYIGLRGIEHVKADLSEEGSGAEFTVIKFVSEQLVREAAEQTKLPQQGLLRLLQDLCYQKHSSSAADGNEEHGFNRLISREELPERVFEEARRGRLRLFEPADGGNKVQLYHLRISELFAAQAWPKEVSMTEAILRTLTKKGLQAPLRFYLPMHYGSEKSVSLDVPDSIGMSPWLDDEGLLDEAQKEKGKLFHQEGQHAAAVAEALGRLRCVESLSFNRWSCMYFAEMGRAEGSPLKLMRSLRRVSCVLEGPRTGTINEWGVDEVHNTFVQLQQLTHVSLVIQNFGVSRATVFDMGKAVAELKNLTHLALAFHRVDFDGTSTTAILEGIAKRLPQLLSLHLEMAGIDLQKEAGHSLGTALARMKNLQELSLALPGCLTDDSAQSLAKALGCRSRVTQLDLDLSSAGTIGAQRSMRAHEVTAHARAWQRPTASSAMDNIRAGTDLSSIHVHAAEEACDQPKAERNSKANGAPDAARARAVLGALAHLPSSTSVALRLDLSPEAIQDLRAEPVLQGGVGPCFRFIRTGRPALADRPGSA